jgi:methanogenic corrinoid protein MtbC1
MNMEKIVEQIAYCIEFGKIDKKTPIPPELKGQNGASELTQQALEQGIDVEVLLNEGMINSMNKVGQKFQAKKIFVPQMLMAAKAMSKAMEHLLPYFKSGKISRKGVFILGTVSGDLHDIGKNLVRMIVEGNGWEVIDLGVDVSTEKFIQKLDKYPNSILGLSALLTTTMISMQKTVEEIKQKKPEQRIIIGGAPVNHEFCRSIGADFYATDPQGAVSYLNSLQAVS